MKKFVLTQNFNCWCPIYGGTHSSKIRVFAKNVKDKFNGYDDIIAINLQEFIGGNYGKYLNEIEDAFDHEFDVIIPLGFDFNNHPKSLLTITLIKKGLDYETINLKSELPNRICYNAISFSGKKIILLNAYLVQTSVYGEGAGKTYINERYVQNENLWSVILGEGSRCKDPLLICGDLQEKSSDKHIQELLGTGFKEFNESANNIDHILFKSMNVNNVDYDEGLVGCLFDHPLVIAKL